MNAGKVAARIRVVENDYVSTDDAFDVGDMVLTKYCDVTRSHSSARESIPIRSQIEIANRVTEHPHGCSATAKSRPRTSGRMSRNSPAVIDGAMRAIVMVSRSGMTYRRKRKHDHASEQ